MALALGLEGPPRSRRRYSVEIDAYVYFGSADTERTRVLKSLGYVQ